LILLDLNMPRKDGREALQEIKGDPQLRSIPVVILTTSKAGQDIISAYDLGVTSFIVKPLTFHSLVDLTLTFSKYWFEIVELRKTDLSAAGAEMSSSWSCRILLAPPRRNARSKSVHGPLADSV